jgi:hypothetical protein
LVSQAPLAQAMALAAALHVPSNVGACPATVGTLWPFGSLATHMFDGVSQYSVLAQSASTAQPPAGTQIGAFRLHLCERQTLPALAAVHGPSPLA